MKTKEHIKMTYDDTADIMYLTSAAIVNTKNTEDEAGLVLRFDSKTRKVVGITILNYREYWISKRIHLARRVSSYFNISIEDASKIIHPVS